MRVRSLLGLGSLAIGAALAAGCGPAPYATGPEPPEVVVASPRVRVASEPPAITSGPFGVGQVWSGTYVCAQGETELRIVIIDSAGTKVQALFDFFHAPSGAKGTYFLDGRFEPETGKIRFRPGAWIVRPSNYITVGLAGSVSPDEDRITGRITNEACGDFDVTLTSGS